MIDLSTLVDAALQVVHMVKVFAPEEILSEKLKYEIARNSMMLTVYTVAFQMEHTKEREHFIGLWANKVSDFKSFEEYKEYVKIFKERAKTDSEFKLFEKHVEGLIVQYRRDSDSADT